MDTATARPTVFVSYSHQDEAWKDRLVKQLRVLELEGDLEVWDDRRIAAGDDWLPEIEAAMARAQVAVLLISADFLISSFIRGKEVPELLRRRESEGLRVIPVIVDPCSWTAVPWLSQIQCRPKDGKPLTSFTRAKAEKHLADLALEIRGLLASPGVQTPGYQEKAVPEVTTSPPRPLQGSIVHCSQGFEPLAEPLAGAVPLHNLPYPPLNDLFTGRQEELDALAASDTTAITQSAAISGLGGIGKTRLAIEYAWRSGNRYTALWFVRADSPESLRRNLAALAGPELLNLPEWEAPVILADSHLMSQMWGNSPTEAQAEDKTVAAVKRWLRENAGWLMILDNVDTPEAADAVLAALPSFSKGRILITSRLTTWPATVRKQSLDKLSPEEAIRFLLHRTRDGREPAPDDATRAGDLAERIDGLPLALEQAAAFILRRRMRLADYLQAWERERTEVLRWHHPRAMEYPMSVAVTWQQTFHRLSPTTAALLRLMAFLASDPIPVDIFEKGVDSVGAATRRLCEEFGKEPDKPSVQEALDELAEYSMITRPDRGMVTVHRLVQEVLRSQIPTERTKYWVENAFQIINPAFPQNTGDPREWPICDRLISHARAVVLHADQLGIAEQTYLLMSKVGRLLSAKLLDVEAEPFLRRALTIAEGIFGRIHSEVAKLSNSLGRALMGCRQFGEAELLMRRALDINKKIHGENHPTVAFMYHNLADVLQRIGRMSEAEQLYRCALAMNEAFGTDVTRDSYCLARLLEDTNRPEEAEPLLRHALARHEAVFGPDHPFYASDLQALARLLQAMHRRKEAEPLIRRAVAIFEKELGLHDLRTRAARQQLDHLRFLLAPSRACDVY